MKKIQPQGRINKLKPVSIIDIGSNSVRLLVYEGLRRSPTPLFNEKVLAGLGRAVASTGRLDETAVGRALRALTRFRAISDQLEAGSLHVLATAAVREAKNGKDFVTKAEAILGVPVQVLNGRKEAKLTALGIVSGFEKPDGIAGDLGGGSLELVRVRGRKVDRAESFPLGVLRLADTTPSVAAAAKTVRATIRQSLCIEEMRDQPFYAIGGSFRALASVHMAQKGYPLHVMHNYRINAREALEFAKLVRKSDPATLPGIDWVSNARRPLLGYGALVLEQIIRVGRPREIILSALGIREGLLYDLLDKEDQRRDPLLEACEELAILRARSPVHAAELCVWTDKLFGSRLFEENAGERRLRHAACYLADIGWRAHPDYRGEQSLSIIANAAFIGLDHPSRAFLSLAVFYRHVGLIDENLSPRIRELASVRQLQQARFVGAALRVAYMISASAPGIISKTPIYARRNTIILELPEKYGSLIGERLQNRLNTLARLLGKSAEIKLV